MWALSLKWEGGLDRQCRMEERCIRRDGDTIQVSPGLGECHPFSVLWGSVLWDAGLLIPVMEHNIWLMKRQKELKPFSGGGWEGGLCLHRRWSASLREDGYLFNSIAQVFSGHSGGRQPPAACVGSSVLLALIHPNWTNKIWHWTCWAFNAWESSGVQAVPHLQVSRHSWWRTGSDHAYLLVWVGLLHWRQEWNLKALMQAAASNY